MAGEKILIVDDDLANALVCRHLLENAGYQPQAVHSAKVALDILQENPFDLLITDIRMPDMDGFELISHAAQINPDLAIILMTGFGTVENAVKALRFGADGLLFKPIDKAEELVDTVTGVLKKRQDELDALRLNILRPLFDISEHLYKETKYEILCNLIVDGICRQTQAYASAIFVSDQKLTSYSLIAGKNIDLASIGIDSQEKIDFPDRLFTKETALLISDDTLGLSKLIHLISPSSIERTCLAPVQRINQRYVFLAARQDNQPVWRDPDKELLAIFARQAVIALENAQLYSESEEYIRQLEESQYSLIQAEKMAALGRLMGSFAHELNNPLQGVQNCLHLAALTELPEVQRQEFIEMARTEVQRVSRLALTAMEFNRQDRLIRHPVDILALIDAVINLVAPQLKSQNVDLIRNLPQGPVLIPLIRDKIQQVILNIILNAQDALLEIPNNRIIWIDAASNEDSFELFIEDNGKGLASAVENHLFEPFVSTKPLGSGLGLSISYEIIVDIHGGEIEFVSPVYGSGARLHISLPRSELDGEN